MAPPARLDTERLLLRRHSRADALSIARQLNNWNVARWLAQVPFPYSERDALDWIAQTSKGWASGRDYQFVIALRQSGELIGHIGLRVAEDTPEAGELGYWFGEEHWGRGYASEAVRAVIAMGFGALGLQRIWATALPDNARSLAVLRKAGLVQTGSRAQHFAPLQATLDVPLLELHLQQTRAA